MKSEKRKVVREWVRQALERGQPTEWFEGFYQSSADNWEAIPWADLVPDALLVNWLAQHAETDDPKGGQRALVVGCGLGDDAEELASRGWSVCAFDVSATAIELCRQRFPESSVDYCAADALALPETWQGQFDLVVEINTFQVLPRELHPAIWRSLAACLKDSSAAELLMICRGVDDGAEPEEFPWPLSRKQLEAGAAVEQLVCKNFSDLLDNEDPPVRRFVASFGFALGSEPSEA